ncbi:MAG TPA: hypothetical protein VGP07_17400 [Polyangia bacterium]|jgi:hypothetical protein
MADAALVRTPDGEIARLEAEIAMKRERVAESLGELRRRVDGATSWRHWVKAHPLLCVGAGVCLGFLVGSRIRGARTRLDR